MFDPLSTLKSIIDLGNKIKTAVQTVQQNVKVCHRIDALVDRVNAVALQLEIIPEVMNVPAMRGAMEGVVEALKEASEIVIKCQETNIIIHGFQARAVEKKLSDVKDHILLNMVTGCFANGVYQTSILINLKNFFSDFILESPVREDDAGFAQISRTNDSTDSASCSRKGNKRKTKKSDIVSIAAFEAKGDKTNVSERSEAPPAFLKHDEKKISLSELKAATNDFSMNNRIGDGGSSTVYMGLLGDDQQVVAVKDFLELFEFSEKRLCDELDLISRLQHKNILQLLRYCYEVGESPVLPEGENVPTTTVRTIFVSKYMENGSLKSFIDGARLDVNVPLISLFPIIQGIADGIHYMHKQRVLHLDLKPSSILLDSDMTPKINYFGTAKLLDRGVHEITFDVNRLPGTVGYMAPEQIEDGTVSTKSDVFAFGVIISEIISCLHTKSLKELRSNDHDEWSKEVSNCELREKFDPELVIDESQLKVVLMCQIVGLYCRQPDPADRPSMKWIVDSFASWKEDLMGLPHAS